LADIQSIHLNVQTEDIEDAGTDGDVYLGICGREFYIDSSADDFERKSSREYILGDGANVKYRSDNDPRSPQLSFENVERFPVYIRFQPRSRTDRWRLQRAQVSFNERFFPRWDTAGFFPITGGIWLGIRAGVHVHIPKHEP
jgi:hypothetical protein